MCEGEGCEHCDDGQYRLTTCARRYVDGYLVRAINMVSNMDNGLLPTAGGLLDQSAWFLDLRTALTNEQNIIDTERMERRR